MGCYGIGVTRTLQAVIEQSNDDNGIIWPLSVAPYTVCITPLNVAPESAVMQRAAKAAGELLGAAVALGGTLTGEHGIGVFKRDHIREGMGGLTFQVSASSFFQTNTRQAERLFELVLDSAGLTGTETVYDLYSGTGAISLLLARRARWVYGVEVTQAAVDDAGVNAAANGITNCTFVCGEVRFILPSLIAKGVTAEVVVADPPRAGFHPKALHALITLGARRIVYVSCNPTTLARDLGELVRGGYRLEWVQPVDMFPHTPHIESVSLLLRASSRMTPR